MNLEERRGRVYKDLVELGKLGDTAAEETAAKVKAGHYDDDILDMYSAKDHEISDLLISKHRMGL